ncbi:uncharacterized protein RAG0_13931 [Rhynchosporium agropyri]|uniref:SET domain-containing protein n=1 Tax=Rhynchosporium agropyri TaxID=914238 RepID=A0A1E1LEV1_9HELO|nr:uncharacterized protein RAG0_13931 [Rhynchosporium agropyri]
MNGSSKAPESSPEIADTSTNTSAVQPAKDKSSIVKENRAAGNKRKHEKANKMAKEAKAKQNVEKKLLDRMCARADRERQHMGAVVGFSNTETDSDEDSVTTGLLVPCDMETDTPPGLLFTLNPSPEKGIGAFANQDIQKGTDILVEEAIMRGKAQWLFDEALFKALGEDKKHRIMSLYSRCHCNLIPCLETPFMKIWSTNAYQLPVGPMLYEIASRFNHACLPNCARGFSKENHMVFRTARDIKRGEELTFNYVLVLRSDEYRLDFFRHAFNSTCDCDCCQGREHYTEYVIDKSHLPNGVETKFPALGVYNDEEQKAQDRVENWHMGIEATMSQIHANMLEYLETLVEAGDECMLTSQCRELLVDEALDAIGNFLAENNVYGLDDAVLQSYLAKIKRFMLAQTEAYYLTVLQSFSKFVD